MEIKIKEAQLDSLFKEFKQVEKISSEEEEMLNKTSNLVLKALDETKPEGWTAPVFGKVTWNKSF